MHEAGVLYEILKVADEIVEKNKVEHIEEIVIQVGELSNIVPEYLEYYYPILSKEFEELKSSRLTIEKIDGIVMCCDCGTKFNVVQYQGYCPNCNSFDKNIISGTEILIKELIVTCSEEDT